MSLVLNVRGCWFKSCWCHFSWLNDKYLYFHGYLNCGSGSPVPYYSHRSGFQFWKYVNSQVQILVTHRCTCAHPYRGMGGKVVGKCKECTKSQTKKDAQRRVAAAEAMGQEHSLEEADLMQAEELDTLERDAWCCIYQVLVTRWFHKWETNAATLPWSVKSCMYVLAQIPLQAQCDWDVMGVCKISQVFPLVLKFHSNLLTYQVIGSHLTANFRQQNISYHNVSICVTSPRYDNSFEKPGSILIVMIPGKYISKL